MYFYWTNPFLLIPKKTNRYAKYAADPLHAIHNTKTCMLLDSQYFELELIARCDLINI